MLSKKYKSKVVGILNPIEGIHTIEFKSNNGKFKYQPGQFLHLALDHDYDGVDQWPDSRCFSMQSNSDDETIKITYAVKGEFTQNMEQELKVGLEVWLKLPYGNLFTQPHNKENTVFIAGGTGITPFLSLFTHESFKEYSNPRIYIGFRSKSHHIYEEELERSLTISESLKIKIVFQDEEGLININQIFSECELNSDYFISGPPAMIKTIKQSLITKGVSINQLHTDDWE